MEKVVKHSLFIWSFLALFVLLSGYEVKAQTNSLQKKITLSVKNESVENTLLKMSELGSYSFSYNSDIIPLDSLVSFNVVNTETIKVLNGMLGMDYYYKTSGYYIIILKKKDKKTNSSTNANNTSYTITGTIIDSRTGKKISTATVYNLNKIETALTDSAGSFALKVIPESNYIGLGVSKVNYFDTIIYIRPSDQNNVELKLSPKPENISKLSPKAVNTISCNEVHKDVFVKTIVSNEMLVNSSNLSYYETRKLQISFLPFAGTNHKLSGSITNKVSLNLLSGFSNGVDGVEVGGILNINKKNVKGLQISGIGNITGGNVNGVQIAGFFNNTMGKVNGVQISGFSNTLFDTLHGTQISGYVNIQRGKLYGTQVSGFVNLTTQDVDKLQLTGYVNIALGNCNGVQTSGFVNIALDSCNGVQTSGFVNIAKRSNNGYQISGFNNIVSENNNKLQVTSIANIAGKESKGTQFSGFLNYAKDVKGYQIGIINVADTVSGLSIGVFNIVRKGYHSINFLFDEMMFGNFSYYIGTYKLYTIIGISTNFVKADTTWGVTFGFGTLLRHDKKFTINIDLTGTHINRKVIWNDKTSSKNKLSVGLNYHLSKHWAITAGPSLNLFVSDKENTGVRDYITDISPHNFYNKSSGSGNYQAWVGYFVGLKFKI